MVSSTVPVESNGHLVEEQTSNKAIEASESHATPAATTEPVAVATGTPEKKAPTAPPVNFWKTRKEALKPTATASSTTVADADKRTESIVENIKAVTLGKSSFSLSLSHTHTLSLSFDIKTHQYI